jgi:branched-chain amino acid transport system substrate-binding protein
MPPIEPTEPLSVTRRPVTRRQILAGALAGLGIAAGPRPARAAPPAIRIGLSTTLTGPNSPPAVLELQGYRLAAAAIAEEGGLLGRKLRIVHDDDRGSTAKAAAIYRKLIADDHVDLLLGPYGATLTASVAPIVDDAKRVMPSLAADAQTFDGRFPYLVQATVQASRAMTPLVELAAARGCERLALLVRQTPSAQSLAAGVRADAARHGIAIVLDEEYAPGTTDFTAPVLRAGAKKPDIVVGATDLAGAEGIIRAARAHAVNAEMFAFGTGPVEPGFYLDLASAADDVFGTTPWFSSLKTAGNAAFVKAFAEEFKREPDYHAALAYASLMALGNAVKAAGSLDQTTIRDALLATPQDTVAGRFALDKTGLQIGYASYALQWQKGRQQLVWPQSQQTAPPVLPHPSW